MQDGREMQWQSRGNKLRFKAINGVYRMSRLGKQSGGKVSDNIHSIPWNIQT